MLRGFPSESQRSSHQAQHTQRLQCYEKDCLRNDIGFPTERSLKNHKKRMHADSNTEPIPKRLEDVESISKRLRDRTPKANANRGLKLRKFTIQQTKPGNWMRGHIRGRMCKKNLLTTYLQHMISVVAIRCREAS